MVSSARILLVGTAGSARSICESLVARGYEASHVADFIAAKTHLDSRPDLLITELKLGAYNGLHLAIRASRTRTPAIVIGDHDPVLEAEAARQDAVYLTTPVDEDNVIAVVQKLLDRSPQTRRSARRNVPAIPAFINESPAHLCDVSYEGMRIESPSRHAPPPYFDIRLPQYNFSCRAQRVWTAPVREDETKVWCGAALATADSETATLWRSLVDEMVVASGSLADQSFTPLRHL